MSGYIESESSKQYFNPVSETIEINPSDSSCSGVCTEGEENLKRWSWLIDNWNCMTFKERMSLFAPKVHYINLRNTEKDNFDDITTKDILDKAYEYCRDFSSMQFVSDRQGIPNMMVIYKPVAIDAIPSSEIKAEVKAWALRYGFVKYV